MCTHIFLSHIYSYIQLFIECVYERERNRNLFQVMGSHVCDDCRGVQVQNLQDWLAGWRPRKEQSLQLGLKDSLLIEFPLP